MISVYEVLYLLPPTPPLRSSPLSKGTLSADFISFPLITAILQIIFPLIKGSTCEAGDGLEREWIMESNKQCE